MLKTYKFRAECLQDAESFFDLLEQYTSKGEYIGNHPDVEFEIKSNLNLEELRNIIRKVDNGHVILQTIQLKENYTGERDYDLI